MRSSLDIRLPIGESGATRPLCESERTPSVRTSRPLLCSQSSHLDALRAIPLHANSQCPCTASRSPHTRQSCPYQSPFSSLPSLPPSSLRPGSLSVGSLCRAALIAVPTPEISAPLRLILWSCNCHVRASVPFHGTGLHAAIFRVDSVWSR
jgi:hypothetical protein